MSVMMVVCVLLLFQSYGVRASSQQCTEAGDVCAICQAEFREPVALMCQVRTNPSPGRKWTKPGARFQLNLKVTASWCAAHHCL